MAGSPTLNRNANGDDNEDSSECVSGLFNVKGSTVTSNWGSVGLPTVARPLISYQLLALQDGFHVTGFGTNFISFVNLEHYRERLQASVVVQLRSSLFLEFGHRTLVSGYKFIFFSYVFLQRAL